MGIPLRATVVALAEAAATAFVVSAAVTTRARAELGTCGFFANSLVPIATSCTVAVSSSRVFRTSFQSDRGGSRGGRRFSDTGARDGGSWSRGGSGVRNAPLDTSSLIPTSRSSATLVPLAASCTISGDAEPPFILFVELATGGSTAIGLALGVHWALCSFSFCNGTALTDSHNGCGRCCGRRCRRSASRTTSRGRRGRLGRSLGRRCRRTTSRGRRG